MCPVNFFMFFMLVDIKTEEKEEKKEKFFVILQETLENEELLEKY